MRRASSPVRTLAAAVGCAALVAAGAAGAHADTTTPTDTTPTPAPAVTVPDAAPTPVPKPDPGPVRSVTVPRHIANPPPTRPPAVAPVTHSVTPVYRPPAQPVPVTAAPRVAPKAVHPRHAHVRRAVRKHPRVASRRPPTVRTTPKPVVAPTVTILKVTPPAPGALRGADGSPWRTTVGGVIAALALTGLAVLVMRRRLVRRLPAVGQPVAAFATVAAPAAVLEPARAPAPTPAREAPSRVAAPVSTNGARRERIAEDLHPIEPAVVPVSAERCTVVWWRGYVRSQFIAYADDGAEGTIIAESPSFAWRSSKPPPQSEDALAAHDRLLGDLRELGWEVDDSGSAWFELTFRRAVGEPSPHSEVPVV